MTRVVRLACLACAVAGCATDSTPSGDSSATAADTSSRPPAFTYSLDTLWRIVGSDSGSPLEEPVAVVADSHGVWVVDRVRGLVALNDSGSPRKIAAVHTQLPVSDFIVLTGQNGGSRSEPVDLSGTRLDLLFAGSLGANDICLTRPGSVLLAGGDHALASAQLSSNNVSEVELPWPELRDSSRLLQQVSLGSAPGGGGCVAALLFGGGFAITEDGESFQTFPTRERVAFPPVDQSTDSAGDAVTHEERLRDYQPAALEVAVTDTVVFLAFAGATPIRLGLIDLYHKRRGTYLGSAAVGSPVRSLAVRHDTVFVLHPFEDRVALTAFRIMSGSESR